MAKAKASKVTGRRRAGRKKPAKNAVRRTREERVAAKASARGRSAATVPASVSVGRASRPARVADDALHKWMSEKANSHGREAILMHRLRFDLQLSAARSGYYLNTYYDDVDHDGFDLIFDDQDSIKKTQVKTVDSKAHTRQWSLHKRILRPSFERIGRLGFEPSPESEGTEGGFILMRFDTSTPVISVDYFYTDLYVCLAFEEGIIRRRHRGGQNAVEAALRHLRRGLGDERVTVPKALMLQARGPDELLALSALHGPANFSWQWHVFQVVNHTRPRAEPKVPFPETRTVAQMKRLAADEIRALVVDKDLLDGTP